MAAFDTAANIINDAAIELGISAAAVSDPFGSNDPNYVQLCKFLKSTGQRLTRLHPWKFLQKEYTFPTVQGVGNYALPADFRNMVDQTGWNRSTRLPLGGPLDAQEWQYLQALLVGVSFTVLFRPREGSLDLFPGAPNTPGGYTIAFEYLSDSWVIPAGSVSTVPTANTVTAAGDTVWFDPFLAVRALKLDFLRAKGFDSTLAEEDYEEALSFAKSADSASPKLSLDGRQSMRNPLLGPQNIPITGYGL